MHIHMRNSFLQHINYDKIRLSSGETHVDINSTTLKTIICVLPLRIITLKHIYLYFP